MYHEFLLYLHIFGQVKIFDLRIVVERLDAQKEEEHIKIYHSEDVNIRCFIEPAFELRLICDLLVIACRHDRGLKESDFLKSVHSVNG